MGSVGATLPWELRISTVAREGKSRVEPSERGSQVNPAVVIRRMRRWLRHARQAICTLTSVFTGCRVRG